MTDQVRNVTADGHWGRVEREDLGNRSFVAAAYPLGAAKRKSRTHGIQSQTSTYHSSTLTNQRHSLQMLEQ